MVGLLSIIHNLVSESTKNQNIDSFSSKPDQSSCVDIYSLYSSMWLFNYFVAVILLRLITECGPGIYCVCSSMFGECDELFSKTENRKFVFWNIWSKIFG